MGMHLAADGKVAHTRSIGESGELPDAYIGRASVFALLIRGDPSGFWDDVLPCALCLPRLSWHSFRMPRAGLTTRGH